MLLFDLLAGTLDGVVAVDRRQRITFWNDAARRILGFPPESVLGHPCHAVFGGTDESGCAVCRKGCAAFSASLRGRLSQTTDVQVNTRHEGRKWLNVTTLVVPSPCREFSLLVHLFRDANQHRDIALRSARGLAATATGTGLDRPRRPHVPLTMAEREILRLLACGATTGAMCTRLGIRPTTVRTHVQHIMGKLGVHTRLEAVASRTRSGLCPPAAD